jgi:hypothetical protein
MDQIYSRAKSVQICIYVEGNRFRNDFLRYTRLLFRWLQTDAGEEIPSINLSQTLQHLTPFSYFGRVWVIQEVALARAAYLHVNELKLLLTSGIIDRMGHLSKRMGYKLPTVLRLKPGKRVAADLPTCLQAGLACKATDERDQVFAVLSLMEPYARSLIEVDYSLGLEQVYTNVIIAIITIRNDLDILSHIGIHYVRLQEDWRTFSCLDIGRFRTYLFLDSNHASGSDDHRLPCFDADSVGL